MNDFIAIPKQLKLMKNWVVWHYEDDKKPPFNPSKGNAIYGKNCKKASSNNSKTWGMFGDACEAMRRGGFDGIGFMLPSSRNVVGLDFDNKKGGIIRGWDDVPASWKSVIEKLPEGYLEISPSGTGLHLVLWDSKGLADWVKCKYLLEVGHVDVYDNKQYLTFTGNVITGWEELGACNDNTLEALLSGFEIYRKSQEGETMKMVLAEARVNGTGMDVEELFKRGGKDPKLGALWRGNIGSYASQNQADMALCGKLAFYYGELVSEGDIDGLFRQSGLMRDKWDEVHTAEGLTYGQMTVTRALAQQHQWNSFYQVKREEKKEKQTQEKHRGGDAVVNKTSLIKQSEMGEFLSDKLVDLAYDGKSENWVIYKDEHWQRVDKRHALKLINSGIKKASGGVGYDRSYLKGVADFIEIYSSFDEWNKEKNTLPFKNGLLNLKTRRLIPHQREHRTTWLIDYDYDATASCEPIKEWLSDCVGGHADQVELLRAYMAGIIRGGSGYQKYLEIIGPGGTGKGSFIRLCEMLVGEENYLSTELQHLEKNRFETANIYGKRLVTITDSQNYAGDVSVLKAMTGEDTLRYEEKNKQSGQGFKFEGMVVIAANEAIRSKDYTSGIARRRITMSFNNQVRSDKRRDLIGEFKVMLPGLINWLLDLSEESIAAYVRDTTYNVFSLQDTERDNLLAVNPMAQWLDEKIVIDETRETFIGCIKRENGDIADKDIKLYPNYVDFCESIGIKAVALNQFVIRLEELCRSQLELDCVARKKTMYGKCFSGLDLRKDYKDTRETPLDRKFANGKKPVIPVITQSQQGLTPSSNPSYTRHINHFNNLNNTNTERECNTPPLCASNVFEHDGYDGSCRVESHEDVIDNNKKCRGMTGMTGQTKLTQNLVQIPASMTVETKEGEETKQAKEFWFLLKGENEKAAAIFEMNVSKHQAFRSIENMLGMEVDRVWM